MAKDLAKQSLAAAKIIQAEASQAWLPPQEGMKAHGAVVVPPSIVKNTRPYIERIANQVNGAYENGWYDACAVMLRRLIETLIIECFESRGISDRVKGANGDFLPMSDLVTKMLAETSWNLSRTTKLVLPKLKDLGHLSAHSRFYIACRDDMDKVQRDVRVVVQELIMHSGLIK